MLEEAVTEEKAEAGFYGFSSDPLVGCGLWKYRTRYYREDSISGLPIALTSL